MVYCRYVGEGECQVGEREFDSFGQVGVYSESIFADMVRGGAVFITDSDFQKLEITAEELAAYANADVRDDAPESFSRKVEMARQVFRDMRVLLLTEGLAHTVISDASNASDYRVQP